MTRDITAEQREFSARDKELMQRALDLARLAEGRTSPNPMVGCVLVQGDEIVGEGYHHRAGTPHAEVHALEMAGKRAAGATAYVTLEPCSHYGRTPPCADALIQAGVRRVVAAVTDPNPLVAGAGLKCLTEAGITVQTGLLAKEAACLNVGFFKMVTSGLPFVTYKSAMTLDGKIATENGDARWVTNERSRQVVHAMRNQYDVIMAGSDTVLSDDPALNCRLPGGRDPVRVIVDGMLRIPEEARVLTSSPTAPCIIATTDAAPAGKLERLRQRENVEVWRYPVSRHVPLSTLLKDLAGRGWNTILLEGGGKLAGAMIAAGLIDKIDFFIAPKLIGGAGPSPLSGLHLPAMAQAIPLYDMALSMETGDLRVTGYIHSGETKEVEVCLPASLKN